MDHITFSYEMDIWIDKYGKTGCQTALLFYHIQPVYRMVVQLSGICIGFANIHKRSNLSASPFWIQNKQMYSIAGYLLYNIYQLFISRLHPMIN
ncbi:hypothetical protein [Paenibacillus shenyangensis]|uniref:hypothetical protein n=1 Tax=Paenibacillus sp. A9 TaxID=1284352 RepID=UPI001EE6BFA7|nr:hypothetical protein [Paenibacillus sp. A9]